MIANSEMTQNKRIEDSYLQGVFYSVNVCHPHWGLLGKQPLPFYHLGLSSKEGDSAFALPEALCALDICRGFKYLENYS